MRCCYSPWAALACVMSCGAGPETIFKTALHYNLCRRPVPSWRACWLTWENTSKAPIIISGRSEEHTSELQSRGHLVCRLLLAKKKSYSDCCKAYHCFTW